MREAPARRSQDLINSRITRTKPGKVLMTSDKDDDRYYEPKIGSAEEEDETTPGVQEGRDF
jgi:hypothetical protein